MSQNAVQESVHGHEVIHLILSEPAGITLCDLEHQVRTQFGAHARFHTCSAEGMTLHQLLAFLRTKGKITEVEGRLTFDRRQMCNH